MKRIVLNVLHAAAALLIAVTPAAAAGLLTVILRSH